MTQPPENAELSACPFCGGEAYVRHHDLEETYSVHCTACQAGMPYVGLTEAEAITAWNLRSILNSPDEAAVERAVDGMVTYISTQQKHPFDDPIDWRSEPHADDLRGMMRAALTAAPGVAAPDGGRS